MLDHLGLTAEHIATIAARGLTLEDALLRSVVPRPAWLEPCWVRSYVTQLRDLAAQGLTLADAAAEMAEPGLTLDEAVKVGWISEDDKRMMEGRATREEIAKLKALGLADDDLDHLEIID